MKRTTAKKTAQMTQTFINVIEMLASTVENKRIAGIGLFTAEKVNRVYDMVHKGIITDTSSIEYVWNKMNEQPSRFDGIKIR